MQACVCVCSGEREGCRKVRCSIRSKFFHTGDSPGKVVRTNLNNNYTRISHCTPRNIRRIRLTGTTRPTEETREDPHAPQRRSVASKTNSGIRQSERARATRRAAERPSVSRSLLRTRTCDERKRSDSRPPRLRVPRKLGHRFLQLLTRASRALRDSRGAPYPAAHGKVSNVGAVWATANRETLRGESSFFFPPPVSRGRRALREKCTGRPGREIEVSQIPLSTTDMTRRPTRPHGVSRPPRRDSARLGSGARENSSRGCGSAKRGRPTVRRAE